MFMERRDETLEVFLSSELGIERAMIDYVVTMHAAGARGRDRREIAVADAEVVEIPDQLGSVFEREVLVKLESIGAAWNSGAHVDVPDAPRMVLP
jgi:hypothetical protein